MIVFILWGVIFLIFFYAAGFSVRRLIDCLIDYIDPPKKLDNELLRKEAQRRDRENRLFRKQLNIKFLKRRKEFSEFAYNSISAEHLEELFRKQRVLSVGDGYGGLSVNWVSEVRQFFKTYLLKGKVRQKYNSLIDFHEFESASISEKEILEDVVIRLCNVIEKKSKLRSGDILLAINAARPSDPLEYEVYCADILRKAGWKISMTKVTGDQGADIVAVKRGRKLVVQCKLQNQPVGNKAVQEVVSALKYYNGSECAVVTNQDFTFSAKSLAKVNGVKLVNDCDLFKI